MANFDPDALMSNWTDEKYNPLHNGKTFEECIRDAFNIPKNDKYVYRAQGETTLAITQRAIGGKRAHGMHNWYHDENNQPNDPPHPSPADTTAYTTLFTPSVSLPKALNAFTSNSKPHTLRSSIATHLHSQFHYPNPSLALLPASKPRTHTNPYLSLWTYACHELEWAGPWPNTVHTKIAHHILPIFYHHFGCVVPSYAALHVVAKLAQPAKPSKEPVRPILDIGSGNGYWTYMLRRFVGEGSGMKALDVRAIDSGLSEYRCSWVNDTIREDGVEYLRKHEGGRGCVLLLVYPQATGGFTERVLRAFEGEAIVVVGTQNGNGFTGFTDKRVDEWVEGNLGGWELGVRMPVPSFAGKDEALYVFSRREGR